MAGGLKCILGQEGGRASPAGGDFILQAWETVAGISSETGSRESTSAERAAAAAGAGDAQAEACGSQDPDSCPSGVQSHHCPRL